jgi:hypothetical protein
MLIWRRRTEYSTETTEVDIEPASFVLEYEEESGYAHEYWNPLGDHEFSSDALFFNDMGAGEEESLELSDDNGAFDDGPLLDDTSPGEWEESSAPDYVHDYWNLLESGSNYLSDVPEGSETSWESGFAEAEVTGSDEVGSNIDDTAFDDVDEDDVTGSDEGDSNIDDTAFDDVDEVEVPGSVWEDSSEIMLRESATDPFDEDAEDSGQSPGDEEGELDLFEDPFE